MNSILNLTNVGFAYNDEKKLIEHFNLTAYSGDFIALAGKNGCGKTTLLKLIAGLLQPKEGIIEVAGDTPENSRTEMSFVFQDPTKQIIGTTVFEDIMFGLRNLKVPKEEAKNKTNLILEELKIEYLANSPTFKLSGGEAQMVAIAGSLVTSPKLLLADEPTSMLDEMRTNIFIEAIQNRLDKGLCLIVSTHGQKILSMATKIIHI